jgi:hypothetical protein
VEVEPAGIGLTVGEKCPILKVVIRIEKGEFHADHVWCRGTREVRRVFEFECDNVRFGCGTCKKTGHNEYSQNFHGVASSTNSVLLERAGAEAFAFARILA